MLLLLSSSKMPFQGGRSQMLLLRSPLNPKHREEIRDISGELMYHVQAGQTSCDRHRASFVTSPVQDRAQP